MCACSVLLELEVMHVQCSSKLLRQTYFPLYTQAAILEQRDSFKTYRH